MSKMSYPKYSTSVVCRLTLCVFSALLLTNFAKGDCGSSVKLLHVGGAFHFETELSKETCYFSIIPDKTDDMIVLESFLACKNRGTCGTSAYTVNCMYATRNKSHAHLGDACTRKSNIRICNTLGKVNWPPKLKAKTAYVKTLQVRYLINPCQDSTTTTTATYDVTVPTTMMDNLTYPVTSTTSPTTSQSTIKSTMGQSTTVKISEAVTSVTTTSTAAESEAYQPTEAKKRIISESTAPVSSTPTNSVVCTSSELTKYKIASIVLGLFSTLCVIAFTIWFLQFKASGKYSFRKGNSLMKYEKHQPDDEEVTSY